MEVMNGSVTRGDPSSRGRHHGSCLRRELAREISRERSPRLIHHPVRRVSLLLLFFIHLLCLSKRRVPLSTPSLPPSHPPSFLLCSFLFARPYQLPGIARFNSLRHNGLLTIGHIQPRELPFHFQDNVFEVVTQPTSLTFLRSGDFFFFFRRYIIIEYDLT